MEGEPAGGAPAKHADTASSTHAFYKSVRYMNDEEAFKECAKLQEASICKMVKTADKVRKFNQSSERQLPLMKERFERHAAMLSALWEDLMTIDTKLMDIRMRLVPFGADEPAEREGD